jgi:hypothetical protein
MGDAKCFCDYGTGEQWTAEPQQIGPHSKFVLGDGGRSNALNHAASAMDAGEAHITL